MPASQVLPTDRDAAQEELFEAAVLFTDMRGSSDLATRTAPREFFRLLNGSLSAQAACVRRHEGEVVKYTGDGLMAVFRGPGRARRALRCALDLARSANAAPHQPFGIGVADGPVLAGLVGPQDAGHRRQHDVLGATVHLAARLCAMAAAGEVLATGAAHAAAQLAVPAPLRSGPLAIPGFPQAVECVALMPAS